MLNNAKNQKYGSYLDWLPVEYLNFWQWEILFADDGELLETNIKSVVSEKEHYFAENIIVLTNGYCFSACASLVATLEKNNLATIIGESPGSLTNVQYGYPLEVQLPNTGLRVIIPAMKFILEDANALTSRALEPAYKVERLRLDVLLGRDPVLEFALDHLKSH
jgi:C-terminal processing protease CtpA/Prc